MECVQYPEKVLLLKLIIILILINVYKKYIKKMNLFRIISFLFPPGKNKNDFLKKKVQNKILKIFFLDFLYS
jgi:hypothetical protein